MHPHAELITRFYTAFADRDAAAMGACYHEGATFSDPAFPDLDARGVRGMWAMLVSRADEHFRIEFSDVRGDDAGGSAHWEAHYRFGPKRRPVHNKIDATFTFEDGLIKSHTDVFDFHAWSKQALGLPGVLLGWSGFLRNQVQTQAGGQLQKFLAKQG